LGVEFAELEGDILFVPALNEVSADEMEEKFALHIPVVASKNSARPGNRDGVTQNDGMNLFMLDVHCLASLAAKGGEMVFVTPRRRRLKRKAGAILPCDAPLNAPTRDSVVNHHLDQLRDFVPRQIT
jgi:hypothetical protein